MRTARLTAVVAAAALLGLAACDRGEVIPGEKDATAPAASGAPPADSDFLAQPKGFRHEEKVDVSGFFLPKDEIQVGNFKLAHLASAAPSDFRAWESGKREGQFGPLMIEFVDVTSPMQPNELGGENHTVTVRVLPSSYSLTKAALAFHGQDATLGPVTFAGAFNQKVLKEAKTSGNSGDKGVLKGDLLVGSKRFPDVAFTYWVGE